MESLKILIIVFCKLLLIGVISGCGSTPSESVPTTIPPGVCYGSSELIYKTCTAILDESDCKPMDQLVKECPARMSSELMGLGGAGVISTSGSILILLGKKILPKVGAYLVKGIAIDKVALDSYCDSLSVLELVTSDLNSTLCQRSVSAGGGGSAGFN